jgi:hypothetical protein
MIYNCRFFCFLASEMAYQARKKSEQYKSDPENHTPLNEYRYCVATVIGSTVASPPTCLRLEVGQILLKR